MAISVIWLVLSLGAILLAAELFTNAIEWFGKRLNLKEGAVGSVLAAVGTALPETLVAVVAIVKGGEEHMEAGIGAVLGAPMMLSTLAMFITGASVLAFSAAKKRPRTINADYRVVGRDLRSFFLVYALAFVAGILPGKGPKVGIAVVLLAVYAYYLHRTFTAESCSECEEMPPLHFHRRSPSPKMRMVLIQLASALALMIFGAKEFVEKVTEVAGAAGISTLVLSLIITPIATELPEKFNSITWMRNRKDTLALGNITGAMVFQSSILPAIGIIFTPWELETRALASIVIAVAATLVLWADMTLRKRLSPYSLMAAGCLYVLYPVFVFGILPRL